MLKIRKAIIPIAGMGTRFLPITKSNAKEMLPIIDKPIIHLIVEDAIKSGIEEILFITSSTKKTVEDYFDFNYELEARLEKSGKMEQLSMVKEITNMGNFHFIRQGEPLGTAHAISLAKTFVGNEPFAVLYGDNLIKSMTPALKQLIDTYEKYDCNVVGVQEVPKEEIYKYGIMDYYNSDSLKIKEMVEKPAIGTVESTSASLGMYILKPEIFEEIEKVEAKNGEYCLTDAMETLINKQDFYACILDGTWYDTGNQVGFLKANIAYAFDNPLYKKEILELVRELDK
ncbi:MAG: UTP--glucose-1-phosphate uridylyltransferase [Bacilli bacterium]